MYKDKTGHISNKPHCSNNGEEKGKGKWVRIIIYAYSGWYKDETGHF